MRQLLRIQGSKLEFTLYCNPLIPSVNSTPFVGVYRGLFPNRPQKQLYQNANYATGSPASHNNSLGWHTYLNASKLIKSCRFRQILLKSTLAQKHDRRVRFSRSEIEAKGLPNTTLLNKRTETLSRTIKVQSRATKVHENIYTIPNILTFSRLIAAPMTGYFILHEEFAWATALLFYAGVTDLVDGWIARRWNLQTVVGTVIDPMADKALMTILTVCLAIQGGLPMWLATIILGRDVSLAIAAIYYRYASLPPPKSLIRYWDFSLPSAEVHPTTISKVNTLLQLLLIGATTALPVAGPTVSTWLSTFQSGIDLDTLVTASQYLVATTTVWSGASYLYTRKAVKILGGETEESKRKILIKGKAVLGVSFLTCLITALALENL